MLPGTDFFLEACCTSVEEVLRAQKGGASRIELCTSLECGGLTPPPELLQRVKTAVDIPVNVLVRPGYAEGRVTLAWDGGTGFDNISQYVFSADESGRLLEQIALMREAGADGIVAGALTPDGEVDLPLLRRIVAAAAPLPVTFHKAFDACREPFEALEQIISAGCARILSSGCAASVADGIRTLSSLIRRADGRIIIMPGGGIRPSNIAGIISVIGAARADNAPRAACATEFHASAAYFQGEA